MPDALEPGPPPFRRAATAALAATGVVALAFVLWRIREALLLGFAGALVAIFLLGVSRWLCRRTPLSQGPALAVTLVTLAVALGGLGWLIGPRVASEFRQLADALPTSLAALEAELLGSAWGDGLLGWVPDLEGVGQRLWTGGMSAAWGAVGGVLAALAVLFVGIYVAADPERYRRGLLHLVPPRHRSRADTALDRMGRGLWRWLLGRFIAILFVGVTTAAGLWLLGVPLPLALGLIAGLFDFVPYIGPIVSAVPAVLLAFTQGPTDALYVALLYLGVQQLEGNIVTPLVQQKVAALPPALVLLSLIAAGLLFGLLGVILATPLLLVALVLTGTLYVEDAIGDDVEVPGEAEP